MDPRGGGGGVTEMQILHDCLAYMLHADLSQPVKCRRISGPVRG